MQLHELSVIEINQALRRGELKVEEVVSHFQKRITDLDPKLQAFLGTEVLEPGKVDPNSSPIAGVPFALKDNMALAGHEATAGSKILKGYIAPYTATAVEKLIKADGIVLGRTNCDEFAMGSSTENSAYGPSRNPWDPERVPGGSSGGSAAAVAAGLVPYALGSDTGGSIRQPAALTGIVGLKPTYGRVSRYGLIALASSLDVIGTFTKKVSDSAVIMNYLAGYDKMDSTTINKEVPDYSTVLEKGIEGLKIGVPKEYFSSGMQSGVENEVKAAIKKLEDLGANIIEVSLPSSPYALPAYYVILPVEASSNLSRYDGIKYGYRGPQAKNLSEIYNQTRGEGFGPEVKRRIMLGTYASSSGYYDAYYKQAIKVQRHIKEEFKKVFQMVDCLVGPTTPTTAFKIGEKADDPLSMYLNGIFSVTANIAGIPAISVPCGFSEDLPVGLQVIAPWFREDLLFQVGNAYEGATSWRTKKPKIF